MYGLPQSTEVKKQLPKKAIYAKFDLKSSQRESFDADVARIDIVAVISLETIPAISEGKKIKEFYLLAVQLKRKEYDTKNIALLSKLISQNILFALQYENETQLAIYHTKILCSKWEFTDQIKIPFSGLNLDSVWENIAKSIGQIDVEDGNTLAEQIKTNEERARIEKQIALLESQARKETQPRKKFELVKQINKLKNIYNG
jgi:hypothetical protein